MSGNYYDILGISEGATPDEIKKAYRARAHETHPDKPDPFLSRDEKKKLFQDVEAAYSTLRDPEKKAQYDLGLRRQREEEARLKVRAEAGAQKRGTEGRSSRDEGQHGTYPFSSSMPEGCISLPENDLALLAALKLAYMQKGDGMWRVRKNEDDKRTHVPNVMFEVRKKGENVEIRRIVRDWLGSQVLSEMFDDKRNNNVVIEERGADLKVRGKRYYGDTLFDEKVLSELSPDFGRLVLRGIRKPENIFQYFTLLKKLGKQLAEGDKLKFTVEDISIIESVINTPYLYRRENSVLNFEDKEAVKDIKVNDLPREVEAQAKRVVQIEGVQSKPEGQKVNMGPEGGGQKG